MDFGHPLRIVLLLSITLLTCSSSIIKNFIKTQQNDKLRTLYPTIHHLNDAIEGELVSMTDSYEKFKMIRYLGCLPYSHSNLLNERSESIHVVYHSASNEHVTCFVASIPLNITNSPISDISKSWNAELPLTLFVPLPRLLKLDMSMISMLHWLHGDKSKNVDCQRHDSSMALRGLHCHHIRYQLQQPRQFDLSISFHHNQGAKNFMTQFESELIEFQRNYQPRQQRHNRSHVKDSIHHISEYNHLDSTMHSLLHDPVHIHSCDTVNYHNIHQKYQLRDQTLLVRLQRDWIASPQAKSCLILLSNYLSSHSEVSYVGVSTGLHLLNSHARGITQEGLSGSEPFTAVGLNGTNVIIGICDSGIDQKSCYFRDDINGAIATSEIDHPTHDLRYRKVIQYVNYSGSNADSTSGHGTHVSGIATGNCIDSNYPQMRQYNGMAPEAKIAFFDIAQDDGSLYIPDQLNDVFDCTKQAGGRIHSNSWGGSAWYDTFSIETDKYLYENQDMSLLFAAGNDGLQGLQTVLSPGMSKNSLAVGASSNTNQLVNSVAYFSAMGPAPDNRIKPDIIAPGYGVVSAYANDEYRDSLSCQTTVKIGTSMATPVASGNVALLQQYFTSSSTGGGYNWRSHCNRSYRSCLEELQWSGILAKAVVLHSGHVMATHESGTGSIQLGNTPDIYQGFGRIQLTNVIPSPLGGQLNSSMYIGVINLTAMSQWSCDIDIYSNDVPLKLTLAWFDPPNEIFAAKTLLHDLDLLVTNLSDLSGAVQHSDSSHPYRDETNTNEQITVSVPSIGKYRIQIQAKHFLSSTYSQSIQTAVLVVTANGVVHESQASITALSPSAFLSCDLPNSSHGNGSDSQSVEVDVALYSLATRAGWGSTTYYSIAASQSTGRSAVTGTFNSHRQSDITSHCLDSNSCYNASLEFPDGGRVTAGTQLGIPMCDLYLTPLTRERSFCLQDTDLSTGLTSCHSECHTQPHINLPLLLEEYYGEGWHGAYFAVTGGMELPGITAGTLEWGFYDIQDTCIPTQSFHDHTCLHVLLTAPTISSITLSPVVYFPNMTQGSHGNDGCELSLRRNQSIARLCMEESLPGQMIVNMTVLAPVQTATRIKQVSEFALGAVAATELRNVLLSNDLTEVGSCRGTFKKQLSVIQSNPSIDISVSSLSPSVQSTPMPSAAVTAVVTPPSPLPTTVPSSLPSSLPTSLPSLQPTSFPTHSPTVYTIPTDISELLSHNTSCLSSCDSFGQTLLSAMPTHLSQSDYSAICGFMQGVVCEGCNSFTILQGDCPLPSCVSSCSVQDWCYYAITSSYSCEFQSSAITHYSTLYTTCVMLYTSQLDMLNGGSSGKGTIKTTFLPRVYRDFVQYMYYQSGAYEICSESTFTVLLSLWFILQSWLLWEIILYFLDSKYSLILLCLYGKQRRPIAYASLRSTSFHGSGNGGSSSVHMSRGRSTHSSRRGDSEMEMEMLGGQEVSVHISENDHYESRDSIDDSRHHYHPSVSVTVADDSYDYLPHSPRPSLPSSPIGRGNIHPSVTKSHSFLPPPISPGRQEVIDFSSNSEVISPLPLPAGESVIHTVTVERHPIKASSSDDQHHHGGAPPPISSSNRRRSKKPLFSDPLFPENNNATEESNKNISLLKKPQGQGLGQHFFQPNNAVFFSPQESSLKEEYF